MKISKELREQHFRIKAWNEYTVQYYGLRMDRRKDTDYLRVEIWQGKFLVYVDTEYQSYQITPARMHEKLYEFLNKYRQVIKPFGSVYEDANFKPPPI